MLKTFLLLILLPAALVAQTAPKPAAPAAKPAAPAPKPAVATAAKPAAPRAAVAPMTDEQKAIYALGLLVQRSLRSFDLSASELDVIKRALTDAAAGKPAVDIAEWGPRIDPLARARAARVAMKEKATGAAYLARAASQANAVKTASGIVYVETAAGRGDSPKATDMVTVHYRGTLLDGTEFDSSYARNEPAQFPLNGVIPCWTEGLQLMKVGGKGRLVCPSDLAYGDAGNQEIPGGATLTFDVELLEIVAVPPAP